MKVPLYYLFMPTEKMNQYSLIEKVEERLKEYDWRLEELHKQTSINYFRLNDFMQENITLTDEEIKQIAKVLDIQVENSLTEKFGLFEGLLNEFGFEEAQVSNLMEYVKSNVK